MIVPSYWVEVRRQLRHGDRQITVRRWGWSDTSESDALVIAEARADKALAEALVDKEVPRRERKVPYNGAEGVPIREEVLERHGDTVITRNGYGAQCLNTPDVLFADVDFNVQKLSRGWLYALFFGLAALVGALGGTLLAPAHGLMGSWGWLVAAFAAVGVGAMLLGRWLHGRQVQRGDDPDAQVLARLTRFIKQNPAWAVRVYRTPAGLRLLATHAPIAPHSAEALAFFSAVGADPLYVRMCLNQRCYRARLTGKPWRMGITHHLRPSPGVWPVSADRLPERNAWILRYDAMAAGFAACHWIESVGSGTMHAQVQRVVDLHDRLSQALELGKPLA